MSLIFGLFFFILLFGLIILINIIVGFLRLGQGFRNLFNRNQRNDENSNQGTRQRTWYGKTKKEENQQKVFSDDEGEYVDFEEIKD